MSFASVLKLKDQRFNRHGHCAGWLKGFSQVDEVEVAERNSVDAEERAHGREIVSQNPPDKAR
jgi:hypothetical protein